MRSPDSIAMEVMHVTKSPDRKHTKQTWRTTFPESRKPSRSTAMAGLSIRSNTHKAEQQVLQHKRNNMPSVSGSNFLNCLLFLSFPQRDSTRQKPLTQRYKP